MITREHCDQPRRDGLILTSVSPWTSFRARWNHCYCAVKRICVPRYAHLLFKDNQIQLFLESHKRSSRSVLSSYVPNLQRSFTILDIEIYNVIQRRCRLIFIWNDSTESRASFEFLHAIIIQSLDSTNGKYGSRKDEFERYFTLGFNKSLKATSTVKKIVVFL